MINLIILFLYKTFSANLGFTFSYLFLPPQDLKIVPKGLNTGLSFKKGDIGLRTNIEVLRGGWTEYYYFPWENYIKKTDFKEIGGEIAILPYSILRETNIYIGFGIFYSYMDYKYKKIYLQDSIEDPINEEKYHSNLLGSPLIVGLEKKIYKKVNFYGELYILFYGILSLKGYRDSNTFKKDYLILGGWIPSHIFEEGKLGKIRMGIKYEW